MEHPENAECFNVWPDTMNPDQAAAATAIAVCALDHLAHWSPEVEEKTGCTMGEFARHAFNLLGCYSLQAARKMVDDLERGSHG